MTMKTIAATSVLLFTLGGCGVAEKMTEKVTGKTAAMSVPDCFAAGGTIERSSGEGMCKMKDGSMKPVQ